MVTYQQFTSDFPEFASTPESQFNFYLNWASLMLTPLWGQPAPAGQPLTIYDIGTELFIAHNLSLAAVNQQAAAGGGAPGSKNGIVNSKSVGDVSVGYDTSAGLEPDAGHWNLTTYGTRFIQMLRLIGAGPSQISPHYVGPSLNGPAWSGPDTRPGWFGS
jgi:hypothetical protein